MWKDLSIQQKSEVMKMAISQGLTDLNEIKKMYDASIPNIEASSVNNTYSSVPYNPSPKDVRYDDGGWLGYLKWKDAIGKYKGIDTNDPAYDYAGFYIENPKRAWALLNDNPNAHFVDTYKTVYHPTFSDESMYSGMVSPQYNPEGLIGGSWRKYPDSFTMSTDLYRSPVSMDERIQYLENNEPEGVVLREHDGSLPMFNDGSLWGGVKPTVEVSPYAYGGPLGNIYKGTGNKSQKLNIWASGAWTADDLVSELLRLGVRARVTSKGRSAKQQARFNTPANRSWHVKNKAIDVVPTTNWDDLKADLLKPEVRALFNSAGIGVLDERPASVQKKTGATGAHFHIGPDRSARAGYAAWTNSKMPNGPQINIESPVFHTAANDLQWQPPIVASSRQEDIAPLLVQDNKPLIVEPLENTNTTPKDFSAIWDQIFPKVENTQKEFNPLLDPSTQFTALQSRPRYQMKPAPIINMPISNGDNDYMLFKPLAKGGNLFEDGSYLRNYQWLTMPQTDTTYTDYETGLPIQAGQKVWADAQGNLVTVETPNALEDYAAQYKPNASFYGPILDQVNVTGTANPNKPMLTQPDAFAERYAQLLAAPIASNTDVDKVFEEQAQHLVDLEIEKERRRRANEGFSRQVDNFFGGNWLRPSQWIGAFNPSGRDTNTTFAERLLLGSDNYGIWNPESQFYREHPYISEGLNIAFDFAAPAAIKGVGTVLNNARKNIINTSHPLNIGFDDLDFSNNSLEQSKFEKYIYGQHIAGENVFPGYQQEFQRGLNPEVVDYLMKNKVGRDMAALEKAGVDPEFIKNKKNILNQIMQKDVQVGRYSGKAYKKAGQEHYGGAFYENKNFISINKDSGLSEDFVQKHEGTHLLDKYHALTDEQNTILNAAFGNDFTNLSTWDNADEWLKGYDLMSKEKVTTNRDARDILLGDYQKYDIHTQNLIIDKMSDAKIVDAIRKANGYGRNYITYLEQTGGLTPEKIQQFREAMKYVGVVTGVIASGAASAEN